MSLTVLGLVLLAAISHACWNSWLKLSGDRVVAMAVIAVGWGVVAVVTVPVLGLPAREAWPYLAGSTLVHTVYSLALVRSYHYVDLNVAYPIARGTGPLFVTVVSAVLLGETLGLAGFTAVALIVAGVFWLGLSGLGQDRRGVVFSLITGGLIGTYTLLDGMGGRTGSPHTYTAWLFLLTPPPIVALAIAAHGSNFARLARPLWLKGVSAGILSAGAYWIVVWAMSIAPMGLVAALRESSVVFAALIGGMMLRERIRWIALILVFSGIVLVRLS